MIAPTNGRPLPEGGPCQTCGDVKAAKVLFARKPLCAGWHACARRMRRKTRTVHRAPDGCFASASTPGAQLQLLAA